MLLLCEAVVPKVHSPHFVSIPSFLLTFRLLVLVYFKLVMGRRVQALVKKGTSQL